MPLFRKKPVVIEAVQLTWPNWSDVCTLIESSTVAFSTHTHGVYIDSEGNALPDGQTSDKIGMQIETLEGVMLARENDWIIKGVNGEIYPCKPDIFEKTYEAVDESTSAAGR